MSMALKYGMMKKVKAGGPPCDEHGKVNCMSCGGTAKDDDEAAMPGEVTASSFAKGGMVDDDDRDMQLVDRIMKSRKGEPTADFETNDFDVSDENPSEEFSYTGANSGDEAGNEAMDENDEDLIRRIMRSRAKKDKMPRPA